MRLLLGALVLALALPAQQMKLTVRQLVQFVQSSVRMRHDDRKVADYLRKQVALTQRLDEATIVELQAAGIGPKTLEALDALKESSKSLPAPAPPAPPKPAATIEPPTQEEQRRAIAEAREYALSYIKRLPDFLCTQVTRRYADPTGLEFWQAEDVITSKLTFFEQKENYKVVLINSRPVDMPMERVGGAISMGEFGSLMKELFDPATEAQFEWTRWTTLRGQRNHVYSYRVSQAKSKWGLNYHTGGSSSLSITPGYQGSVFVERDTRAVSRITLEAVGIPPSFPIQQATTQLDYDLVPIGDAQFMLPLRFTMRMRQAKYLTKNDVEFRMYQKFGADAVIKFDTTPDPLPEDKIVEQPPK